MAYVRTARDRTPPVVISVLNPLGTLLSLRPVGSGRPVMVGIRTPRVIDRSR